MLYGVWRFLTPNVLVFVFRRRYLSLYDACPAYASSDLNIIAANDDDESCTLSDAGASSIDMTSQFDVTLNTSAQYYLAVERYALGADLVFDPGFNYTYELTLNCFEVEITGPPCPAPTPLECGECIKGYLGYGYDNSSNTSTLETTPKMYQMFEVNISEAYYNTTITATTCLADTNFDTYLSLYNREPCDETRFGNQSALRVLGANDDDDECMLSDAGASSLTYTSSKPENVYLGLEKYALGEDFHFELTESYDYEVCLICEIVTPEPTPAPSPAPTIITPAPTPFVCDVIDLQCGDTVYGFLGYNITNETMLDDPVNYVLYAVNLTDDLYNLTISASTCEYLRLPSPFALVHLTGC